MRRNLNSVRAALAAAGISLALATAANGEGPCPPNRPVVSGPSEAIRFQGYSISWTNVLVNRGTSQADVFIVERSEDQTFARNVERLETARTSMSWGAPGGSPRSIYHRVAVQSYCGGATPVRVESAVFAVRVTDQCSAPLVLEPPVVSPAQPPAYTTYIVSWDTLGVGEPGPGGGAQGLRFRLRRTAGSDVKDSLNDSGAASFADPPGEYLYQVRTENVCGDASEWSAPARVVVGTTKTSALVLVSAPKPVFVSFGKGTPSNVPFGVRNAGSETLDVTATVGSELLTVSPGAFRLEPGEARTLTASVTLPLGSEAPFHGTVTLSAAGGVSLHVPIDAASAGQFGGGPSGDPPPAVPVVWEEDAVDIDKAGSVVTRRLVNPASSIAYVLSSISAEWLTVTTPDGKPWDRPLEPGESRTIVLNADRSRRRAAIGTEVATVTVLTSSNPGEPTSLSVIDDGPQVTGVGAPSASDDIPPLFLMKSRLLFPSLPNALDARGAGRYTSDVWLSNVDAISPIQVVMTLTPPGQSNTSAGVRQFAFYLGAGETRRFRNVIGTIFGYEGGCSLDISSPSTTLSATAMVSNKPLVPLVAGARGALGTAATGTLVSTAEFGFEMRPVSRGEGVTFQDRTHVVSSLWHDARRRTNLILRETTENETVVRIQLFDDEGNAVVKDGAPVDFEKTVPALGSLQINDEDLFPSEVFEEALRVRVDFVRGTVDPFGQTRGAVVPIATVIDSGTQDAALKVGISEKALAPTETATDSSLRALGLPYEGRAEPLLFPAAHVTGAALSSGHSPRWRTRITLANVNDTEPRNVRLRFVDKSGNLPSETPATATILVPEKRSITIDDILEGSFLIPPSANVWGSVFVDAVRKAGSTDWEYTWADVDVQTETYTADTENPSRGEFRTGMEAFSYRHGYSSFQSNLGTVLIDGAETSVRNRTNLILQEVAGASCTLAVGLYRPGSIAPLSVQYVTLKPGDYVSRELFHDLMKLDLEEVVDARVVVRQLSGDGVFMAFVSKINLVTGDPANVFLRPASAGTGR